MYVNYITAFTSSVRIRYLKLNLFDHRSDDDGYTLEVCETLECISEMTGWESAYQLAVF